jgi:hypothetical protein
LGAFAAGGSASAARAGAGGVKVHGQWTVVVRSKSGQVVRRYNFHNEFQALGASGGDGAFSAILAGNNVAGDWDVSLQGNACPASNGNFCQLFEPDASPSFFAPGADTKNLVVTVPTGAPDAFKIVLSGSVPATNDGTITRVSTGLQKCSAGSTVGQDCSIGYNAITDRTLSSPITVSAGQSMAVTVKLSFS